MLKPIEDRLKLPELLISLKKRFYINLNDTLKNAEVIYNAKSWVSNYYKNNFSDKIKNWKEGFGNLTIKQENRSYYEVSIIILMTINNEN